MKISGQTRWSWKVITDPYHLMSGSHKSLSGWPPCPQSLTSPPVLDAFACLIILKNYLYPKIWNNYHALWPTLQKTRYCKPLFLICAKKPETNIRLLSQIRKGKIQRRSVTCLRSDRKLVAEPGFDRPSQHPDSFRRAADFQEMPATAGRLCQSPWRP